jgi:Na+:H+ antiporter, NhaA family
MNTTRSIGRARGLDPHEIVPPAGPPPAARAAHRDEPRHSRAGRGLARLRHVATEYLLPLPLGAAMAMAWVSIGPESYFRTAFALEFAVMDVAMVFFFALVTKEIVEATAPGGVLHSWRRVLLPMAGAVGITIVPALLFAAVAGPMGEPRIVQGWPAVLAVDLAAAYVLARVIFGRHPVFPFFLLVAISANGIAFLALAAAAPLAELRPLLLVVLMGGAIALAAALRRLHVQSFWPYVLAAGGLSWSALYFGGLHPALALLPILPFVPHARRDPGFFVDAGAHAHDALGRFERWCRPPALVALFLFGLIAAGVPLRALEAGTWALPLAAIAGKPFGLIVAVALGMGAGLHLPHRVTWKHLVVVGFVTSVGFTMALFFSTAAIGPGPVLSTVKMGALLTIAGALPALVAARVLRVGRFAGGRPHEEG